MQRAFEVGPLPMHVGAVLLLDREVEAGALTKVLEGRLPAAPRLRQRVRQTPPGLGRPIWVDDAGFDLARHVTERACPPPGDEAALLALAAAVYTEALPWDRPLWRAVAVTGLAGGRGAVVLVLHHVLADGVGGLAALQALVDGAPAPPPVPFPTPAPSPLALAADAWRERAGAVGRLPAVVRSLRPAATELGRRPRATGAVLGTLGGGLALAVARVPLGPLKAAARRHGATVNDAVLAAVAGALGARLRGRGRPVGHLVVSVPVAAERAPRGDAGNRIGVMPVAVPTDADRTARLRATAAATAVRKTARRGASTTFSRPLFRALGALHLFGPFVRRQRLVDIFVTNVRGPAERHQLAGATVTDVVPLAGLSGNVTVAFAVLSYGGGLTVTISADPDAWPDLPELARTLQAELAAGS